MEKMVLFWTLKTKEIFEFVFLAHFEFFFLEKKFFFYVFCVMFDLSGQKHAFSSPVSPPSPQKVGPQNRPINWDQESL